MVNTNVDLKQSEPADLHDPATVGVASPVTARAFAPTVENSFH